MLIQDHSKDPFYNIVGYKITSKGRKVRLHTLNLEDVLLDNPDLPVDISEVHGEEMIKVWEKEIKETRNRIKKIIEELKD